MGSAKKAKALRETARPDQRTAPPDAGWSWRAFSLTAIGLAALTFAVYFQVLHHDFFQLDDGVYVTENPAIQGGITGQAIAWAFTTFHCANWHPLTWLSLMLDYRFWSLNPTGYHLTNLLFHIANTILLFLVLALMTRSLWKSTFVAALFALHPLHAESVVWVAERKDVLSTFFWMLTMLAYWYYTKRPNMRRYAWVILALTLGLMAKPMLVSLPLVLLMLDYWPLRRARSTKHRAPSTKHRAPSTMYLLLEKAPLLVLSAASSVITMIAQTHGGAVVTMHQLPLTLRISNALTAYFQYLVYTVWPVGLSFFYTRIRPVSIVCMATLVLISAAVALLRKRHPCLAVGWLWYVVTLIPVIGLVQVGSQLMADRYTYVPLIGIFIAAAWGVPELLRMGEREIGGKGEPVALTNTEHRTPNTHSPILPHSHAILSAAACLAVAVLGIGTFLQVGYWQDDVTLAQHAIQVDSSNFVAHDILGLSLAKQGRLDEAISHYQTAINADSSYAQTYNDMGIALRRQGRLKEAAGYLIRVLDRYPDFADAHANLGNVYHQMGRHADELAEYTRAVQLSPNLYAIRINTADALMELGMFDEAVTQICAVLAEMPNSPDARLRLAGALYGKGDYRAAWEQVHVLRQLGSDAPPAFLNALSARMPDPAP